MRILNGNSGTGTDLPRQRQGQRYRRERGERRGLHLVEPLSKAAAVDVSLCRLRSPR